jgi:hypothetical protein
MLRLICFALTALVASACSNSSSQRGSTIITPNTRSPFNFQPIPASRQVGQSPATATSGAINPAHGQPGHRCDIPEGAALNTAPVTTTIPAATTSGSTTNSTAATATLNPAHGQPGHRCDLAVGAPLTSAPAKATTTTANTTQPTTAVTTTPSTVTKPGMNPPHGQPGHRCDISVGAPLNSAPATTAATTTTTPAPTVTVPTATPVTTTPSTVSSVTQALPSAPATTAADKTVKLNPAHGQPGHDCSIAVGQPLKN